MAKKVATKKQSTKKPADFAYLHGFSPKEQNRLRDQARFSEHTIYNEIDFSMCKNLLEVGSGVGAQTEILLRRFPNINLTGIDLSASQLQAAEQFLKTIAGVKGRYKLKKMDATDLEFESHSFDGAFLCWVLEHMPEPKKVLSEVRRVVRPGGYVVVNEVMNSSFFLDPYSPNMWHYWMAFNDYQNEIGGDPFVGMKLGNLLLSLGFTDIKTTIKTWHFDNRNPEKRKSAIEFWSNLLLSASDSLIKSGKVTSEIVDEMKKELKKVAADPNAVFHFSFMQARARVM